MWMRGCFHAILHFLLCLGTVIWWLLFYCCIWVVNTLSRRCVLVVVLMCFECLGRLLTVFNLLKMKLLSPKRAVVSSSRPIWITYCGAWERSSWYFVDVSQTNALTMQWEMLVTWAIGWHWLPVSKNNSLADFSNLWSSNGCTVVLQCHWEYSSILVLRCIIVIVLFSSLLIFSNFAHFMCKGHFSMISLVSRE